jgi:hypothetical protein
MSLLVVVIAIEDFIHRLSQGTIISLLRAAEQNPGNGSLLIFFASGFDCCWVSPCISYIPGVQKAQLCVAMDPYIFFASGFDCC